MKKLNKPIKILELLLGPIISLSGAYFFIIGVIGLIITSNISFD